MIQRIKYFHKGLVICLIIIGLFWVNQVLFSVLTFLLLLVGLFLFASDRRELKKARFYSRIEKKRDSALKVVLDLALLIGVVLSVIFLNRYLEDNYAQYFNKNGQFFIPFLFLSLYLEDYYFSYINSIRSFSGGIKLPNDRINLVPWQAIEELSISENQVTIVQNDSINSYLIEEKDLWDMKKIIENWEQVNLGLNTHK